ncbi:hypothetical protein ACO2Q8_11585 [Larkinella sp. VNQ87]|uniref:hypothetical protein n=1 Tax=Larkinella sp. VNQ87 TaxID=3400921 RepID=UPI003C05FD3E
MKKTTLLSKALWANVIFAEVGALAFLFLGNKLPFLDEMAGGRPLLLGAELLLLSGLATYAALRPAQSRRLIQVIVAMNLLLAGFYLETLFWGPTLSVLAFELLLLDTAILVALAVAQVVGLRAVFSTKNVTLTV